MTFRIHSTSRFIIPSVCVFLQRSHHERRLSRYRLVASSVDSGILSIIQVCQLASLTERPLLSSCPCTFRTDMSRPGLTDYRSCSVLSKSVDSSSRRDEEAESKVVFLSRPIQFQLCLAFPDCLIRFLLP
jgi:hypothetical protein